MGGRTPRSGPPQKDRDHDRIPDWVEKTIQVVDEVARLETADFGYRLPLADRGPGGRQEPGRGLDVYLADVGAGGLYGYCTRDPNAATVEANPAGEAPSAADQGVASAVYCVIDDDFSEKQFPSPDVSGARALKVTVAHEFFHAIQFAYTAAGNDWLREGTAVWMEDEVFDSINANRRYLPSSPLTEPEVPLDVSDTPNDGDNFEYGAWIFWRFLTEYFGTRDVGSAMFGSSSWQDPANTVSASVDAALDGRRPNASCKLFCEPVSFSEAFLEFARWNLDYANTYEEGREYIPRLGCSVFPDAGVQPRPFAAAEHGMA